MLGLGSSLAKGGASLLTFIKDNLKLYLDFTSNKSDTLKFPSEGSTSFVTGSSQHINIGVQSSLQFASGTYAVWIYPTGNGVIYSRYVGPSYDIRWEVSGTTILCAINSINRVTTPTDSITLNAWNHVAISISSSSILTYVNGSLVDTDSGIAIDTNAVANKIGYGDFGTYFGGKMANLGAWSRILSPEEVQSIMNKSYSQLKGVETTSLVSWWALDSAVLGSELIADGDFSSSDNWTESSGWTIDTTQGKAIYVPDGENLYRTMPYTDATLNTSAEYEVTITIDSCSDFTNCGIVVGGSVRNFSPSHVTSTGTTTFSVVIGRADLQLWSQNASITISNISVKEKNVHTDSKGSNNGVNVGATTTTSVYGGNAPILPRAVDVAKEGQADAIGNGSASFNGTSDYVDFGADVYDFSSGNFTLTAWIYHDTASGVHSGIFGVRDSTNTEVQFYIQSSTDKLASWNGSSNVLSSSTITDEEWTHVAMVQSGNNKKFYINGILDNTASQANGTARPATLKIGYTGSSNEYFLGNVSQAGIWAGELTQSQIQSLMESTSYSKIPADVKSTLGSEKVLEPSFASNTGWATEYFGTGWSITGNKLVSDGSQSAGSNASALITTSAGLYKVIITVDSISSGTIRPNLQSWGSYISTAGTHTQYFTLTGNNNLTIQANADFVGSISFVSVKEVTNDLVAYYPLDAVQPSDFTKYLVPDATGGVLGAELFTGWENNSLVNQGHYAGWSSFTTSGQTVTASQADEGGAYSKVFNTNAFSIVEGTTYEVNITIDSRTNTYIRGLTSSTNSEGTFVVFNDIWQNTAVGNAKYVLLANTTSSSARLHIRQQPSRNTSSITISAISIKPLSGNYGRLL